MGEEALGVGGVGIAEVGAGGFVAVVEVAALGGRGALDEAALDVLRAGDVQGVVLADEEDRPLPEILVLVVGVQPGLHPVALADVERRHGAPVGAGADEDVDARALKLFPLADLLVGPTGEGDADAGPVRLVDDAQAVGIAVRHEEADAVGGGVELGLGHRVKLEGGRRSEIGCI